MFIVTTANLKKYNLPETHMFRGKGYKIHGWTLDEKTARGDQIILRRKGYHTILYRSRGAIGLYCRRQARRSE